MERLREKQVAGIDDDETLRGVLGFDFFRGGDGMADVGIRRSGNRLALVKVVARVLDDELDAVVVAADAEHVGAAHAEGAAEVGLPRAHRSRCR